VTDDVYALPRRHEQQKTAGNLVIEDVEMLVMDFGTSVAIDFDTLQMRLLVIVVRSTAASLALVIDVEHRLQTDDVNVGVACDSVACDSVACDSVACDSVACDFVDVVRSVQRVVWVWHGKVAHSWAVSGCCSMHTANCARMLCRHLALLSVTSSNRN